MESHIQEIRGLDRTRRNGGRDEPNERADWLLHPRANQTNPSSTSVPSAIEISLLPCEYCGAWTSSAIIVAPFGAFRSSRAGHAGRSIDRSHAISREEYQEGRSTQSPCDERARSRVRSGGVAIRSIFLAYRQSAIYRCISGWYRNADRVPCALKF